MANPCCCPLHVGVKAVLIIEMIKAIILIAVSIFFMVWGVTWFIESSTGEQYDSKATGKALSILLMIITSITIIVSLVCFIISFLLCRAGQNRQSRYSKIWLIIYGILWVLSAIIAGYVVASANLLEMSICVVILCLQAYNIAVVFAFRRGISLIKGEGYVVCHSAKPGAYDVSVHKYASPGMTLDGVRQ